jgi:hypothetical protein
MLPPRHQHAKTRLTPSPTVTPAITPSETTRLTITPRRYKVLLNLR